MIGDPVCAPPLGPLVFVSGVQFASQVWGPPNTYVLDGLVSFQSGTQLTILPGTTVLGRHATMGFLVIERGAKLVANGTSAQPIVMTSDLASPFPGAWGGLWINGKGIANCNDCLGGFLCSGMGGAGPFCGADDCDDSGEFSYMRIHYAGFNLGPGNDVNSFTFAGVGPVPSFVENGNGVVSG